jgi:hypothetical protein
MELVLDYEVRWAEPRDIFDLGSRQPFSAIHRMPLAAAAVLPD